MTKPGTRDFDPDLVNNLVRAQYVSFKSIATHDLTSGSAYSAGKLFEDIQPDETVNVLLQNPEDSEIYIDINSRYLTQGSARVHKTLNVDVIEEGTPSLIIQRRSDISDGNEVIGQDNATVDESVGRKFNEKPIGGGTGVGTLRSAEIPSLESLIAPGDNVCFFLENTSDSAYDAAIEPDFIEVPAELIESLPVLEIHEDGNI